MTAIRWRVTKYKILIPLLAALAGCQEETTPTTLQNDRILLQEVPDNGIQPKMAIDGDEDVHLIYFKPEEAGVGDLYYRQLDQSSGSWSVPVRVSSTSYRHQDAISKASIAVDDGGRIHVTWLAQEPFGYRYARSNPARTAFENERRVITEHLEGVEAEATVAVIGDTVTISWHAGELIREDSRAVYAVSSADGGETFGAAKRLSDPALGACACCGLASFHDDAGRFFLAYRSAIDGKGRHMQMLATDPGQAVPEPTTREVSQWFLETCPVSSNNFALVPADTSQWLAFETRGEIWLARAAITDDVPPLLVGGDAEVRQKHPAIAVNRRGEKLIVWGEAPGYFEGGALTMAMLDADNRLVALDPLDNVTMPAYSVPAVAPLRNGNFLVMY